MAILAVALASACGTDATGPGEDANLAALEEMASLAYGRLDVGNVGGGDGLIGRLDALPPNLALTAAQAQQIAALVAAFETATAADRDALAGLRVAAAEARRNGATPDQVHAILAGGAEIRARLLQAELALRHAITDVLTPAQRAWLTGRTPPEPRPCALTEAQRTEISGIRAAFEQSNAADIALVRSVHDRARAAHQSGASRDDVAAILAEGRDAVHRLKAAHEALHAAIQAVLTAEQRAAGCLR